MTNSFYASLAFALANAMYFGAALARAAADAQKDPGLVIAPLFALLGSVLAIRHYRAAIGRAPASGTSPQEAAEGEL